MYLYLLPTYPNPILLVVSDFTFFYASVPTYLKLLLRASTNLLLCCFFYFLYSHVTGVTVYNYNDIGVVTCGGIEMRGLKASLAPRRQQQQAAPKLEKYVFVPFENEKVGRSITYTFTYMYLYV